MLIKSVLIAMSFGYILCVIAKKQTGILKSLGYTLGVIILALSLFYGLMMSWTTCTMMGKSDVMCGMKGSMVKAGHHQMMKR